MRQLLIATLFAASLLAAQDNSKAAEGFKPGPDFEATIIPIKTLSGDAFDRMVRMLDVFGARIRADSKLRTIVVYAPPKITEQIQKVVADLDKEGSPAAIGRNIDMTISLIECLGAPRPDAKPVPPELANVAEQLTKTMGCTAPNLWETLPFRVQEGGRGAEQSLNLNGAYEFQPQLPRVLQVKMTADNVGTKGDLRYVRFSAVNIGLRVPVASGSGPNAQVQYQYMEAGINTSGDFFENQKTVVGRLSGSSGPVYAVIALKILD